jgi:hypothetical protein
MLDSGFAAGRKDMAMRRLLVVAFCVGAFISARPAGEDTLPDIPRPKLTASEAVAISQRHGHDSTKYTLVTVDWCKASEFKSRYSVGTCTPGDDHPNDYSWFLSYVFKDDEKDQRQKSLGLSRPKEFNSVAVDRINDDGRPGVFICVQ